MTVEFLKALLSEYDNTTDIKFVHEEYGTALDLIKVSHDVDLTEEREILQLKFYNYVE